MAGTKRRSTRQAATRKRSIYAEPDTDDDFEAGSEEDFQPEQEPQIPPAKVRKIAPRHRPQTRSKAKSKQAAGRPVRSVFKVGKPRKANSKALPDTKKEFSGPSDHRIPDWASLPVDILRDIFVFASQPIHVPSPHQHPEAIANVSWLLKTARLACRSFAQPALEAYYISPSVYNQLHLHHLLDLLRIPKDKRYLDYNVKVRSLYINVRQLAYVAHGKLAFELGPLVAELPRLQHVEIFHPQYLPPYRSVPLSRWTFPPMELFDIMKEHGIRLKSWRWSRDMIPKNAFVDLYGMMTEAHESTVFSRLERLVVCGFNYEDSSEPVPDNSGDTSSEAASIPAGLATSIQKLPSLTDLTFISCDIIMNKFLLRLPRNLERLELSNCLEITSDMMREFFVSSGSQLKELILRHNAALNLSFLQELKASCPKLQVLKIDLHYYSEKVTVNDAEAFYDELLSENETPTWPSTLRHLEITHAQKWAPVAAQKFFRSLVESATDLPDLRHLILHAHINIPWRDRVGFRDQWIERLRRVYLRRNTEPFKHLGSLKQYRMWKVLQENADDADELGLDYVDSEAPLHRLSHVQISPHKPSGDTEVYSDSDIADTADMPAKGQPRRSKRVKDSQFGQVSITTSPDSEESESEDESGQEDWRKQPEKFIQGLCEVVDVRIDNQRPREEQFTEAHFLDSEISGDEDWREGADSGEEETYAW